MYARAFLYWTFTFSCFLRSSASSGTSEMPSSSSAISVIRSSSFNPFSKGLSASIGRHKLFTFMVFCSSIFNEASPMNCAEGLKILLMVRET